jgi:hypothetical protein
VLGGRQACVGGLAIPFGGLRGVALDDKAALVHHADIERRWCRAEPGRAQKPAGAGLRVLWSVDALEQASAEFLHRGNLVLAGPRAQLVRGDRRPIDRLAWGCRRSNRIGRRGLGGFRR